MPSWRDFVDVAVCRGGAGVAEHRGQRISVVAGRPVALTALLREVGGRHVGVGRSVRRGDAWWVRLAPSRVLLVEPRPCGARPPRVGDVAVTDAGDAYALLALAGPRAEALADGVDAIATLRPAADLVLLVVAAGRAAEVRARLLTGAVPVSPEAIDLLWVAEAVVQCQRPARTVPARDAVPA